MGKPTKGWAIVHKASGRIDIGSVRWSRKDAVKVWSDGIGGTWEYWRKRGWSAEKVSVSMGWPEKQDPTP
jgi:hypothetical protein